MKFLLFLFLCIAICLETANSLESYTASVMVNGTIFHRCSAFFVTSQDGAKTSEATHLVTTASCLFGIPQNRIIVGVGNEIFGKEVYRVKNINIHPNYSRSPDLFNIAVIQIDRPATNVQSYKILNSTDFYGFNGSLHLWGFVDEVFELTKYEFIYVTDEIYERATDAEIRENEVAIMSYSQITTGKHDEGTPFILSAPKKNEKTEKDTLGVLGFLVKPNLESNSKFLTLYSIPFYYKWINEQLTSNERY